jgi:hypothetical protein
MFNNPAMQVFNVCYRSVPNMFMAILDEYLTGGLVSYLEPEVVTRVPINKCHILHMITTRQHISRPLVTLSFCTGRA